jgi:hypothetical protein
MDASSTSVVVDIARDFIGLMREVDPAWEKAFHRFRMDGARYGSNGSYVSSGKIHLISALQFAVFYREANEKGLRLLKALGRERGVFLLTIDCEMNYHVDFEWEDLDKWGISKIDGESGLPNGLELGVK